MNELSVEHSSLRGCSWSVLLALSSAGHMGKYLPELLLQANSPQQRGCLLKYSRAPLPPTGFPHTEKYIATFPPWLPLGPHSFPLQLLSALQPQQFLFYFLKTPTTFLPWGLCLLQRRTKAISLLMGLSAQTSPPQQGLSFLTALPKAYSKNSYLL